METLCEDYGQACKYLVGQGRVGTGPGWLPTWPAGGSGQAGSRRGWSYAQPPAPGVRRRASKGGASCAHLPCASPSPCLAGYARRPAGRQHLQSKRRSALNIRRSCAVCPCPLRPRSLYPPCRAPSLGTSTRTPWTTTTPSRRASGTRCAATRVSVAGVVGRAPTTPHMRAHVGWRRGRLARRQRPGALALGGSVGERGGCRRHARLRVLAAALTLPAACCCLWPRIAAGCPGAACRGHPLALRPNFLASLPRLQRPWWGTAGWASTLR